MPPILQSRFAAIRPVSAWLVLAFLAGFAAYGAFSGYPRLADVSEVPKAPPALSDPTGRTDGHLYYSIIRRLKAGESYYAAATDELRQRGYALRPLLNVRLPTLARSLAVFPNHATQRAALWILVLVTVSAWARRLKFEGASPFRMITGALLVGSGLALHVALVGASLHHEVWASCFLALSLAFNRADKWKLSVVLGLAAALIRELTLPYLVVMMAFAWFERRLAEVWGWLAAIAAFATYLSVHALLVMPFVHARDKGNTWLRAGGLDFVLSTTDWNGVLLFLPGPLAATLVALALMGLIGWPGRLGSRLATVVGTYMLAFSLVGRPDNFYWGVMYAPLIPLGLLYAGPSLHALLSTRPARSR